jgi:curved DNA-binding protein CbpA
LRTLPLTPPEAFVLSRIDGQLTARDLASMTGMDEAVLEGTLHRLADLGAVTWEGGKPVARVEPKGDRPAEPPPRRMRQPAVETYQAMPEPEPAKALALYDPAELDEDCELPEERRRSVLDTFYRLDDLTHYELLDVPQTATKKEIKDAYYRLASEYHPDRYFRKNLGAFKQKMELVFGRITQAHDTLTRKQTREEYDAYLKTLQSTRRIEESLQSSRVAPSVPPKSSSRPASTPRPRSSPAPASTKPRPAPPPVSSGPVRADSDRVAPDIDVQAAWAPPRTPTATNGGQVATQRSPDAPAVSTAPPSATRESMRARREAFAARISGGRMSRVPPPPSTEPPVRQSVPPVPPVSAAQAGEALRRHVAERKDAARRAQIKKYVDAAQRAQEQGDPAAAANAYQLALQLSPEDPDLVRAHVQAQASATSLLADSYLQQARYEERAERWREAARSYTRAADGMLEDADVQSKAAETMLKANLDMRKAAEYAKRATGLNPKNPNYHVILGKIYLAAGLLLNGRRELELAAELAPNDATIARLVEAVRKGGRS